MRGPDFIARQKHDLLFVSPGRALNIIISFGVASSHFDVRFLELPSRQHELEEWHILIGSLFLFRQNNGTNKRPIVLLIQMICQFD
jgi:hypothetical protein